MSLLWVPYIIFKNTDSDEAVTVGGDIRTIVAVTREGQFVRSGPEVVDEVYYIVKLREREGQRAVSTILHHSHPYFIYEVIMKYI